MTPESSGPFCAREPARSSASLPQQAGTHPQILLRRQKFLRRFLQHVPPRRFVRIRYYGFMAGRNRNIKLNRCRQLLPPPPSPEAPVEGPDSLCVTDGARCPKCKEGRMQKREELLRRISLPVGLDSS
ncbi:transposase [Planctomycetota bacterium]